MGGGLHVHLAGRSNSKHEKNYRRHPRREQQPIPSLQRVGSNFGEGIYSIGRLKCNCRQQAPRYIMAQDHQPSWGRIFVS